jgi:16S rRNA G527 N7-methylase RsmG
MSRGDAASFEVWFKSAWPNHQDSLGRLHIYGEALIYGSKRMSLVSKADQNRIYMRHLKESLHPDLVARFPEGADVLDVGSGNGLPGLPLAILRPDLMVTLLEPRGRRVAFLDRCLLLSKTRNAIVSEGSIEGLPENTNKVWGWSISRALRWTPKMIAALEKVSSADATHLRLGSRETAEEEYPVSTDRVIQVWPRANWERLSS